MRLHRSAARPLLTSSAPTSGPRWPIIWSSERNFVSLGAPSRSGPTGARRASQPAGEASQEGGELMMRLHLGAGSGRLRPLRAKWRRVANEAKRERRRQFDVKLYCSPAPSSPLACCLKWKWPRRPPRGAESLLATEEGLQLQLPTSSLRPPNSHSATRAAAKNGMETKYVSNLIKWNEQLVALAGPRAELPRARPHCGQMRPEVA